MKNLVFIFGASRSGTTLLSRTLGLHSKVHQFEELHYFDLLRRDRLADEQDSRSLIKRLIEIEYFKGLFLDVDKLEEVNGLIDEFFIYSQSSMSGKTYDEIFTTFVGWTLSKQAKKVGVEQTGLNLLYDSELKRLWEDRIAMGIIRHPFSVLSSQKNRWRIGKNGKRKIPWSVLLKIRLRYNPWLMARIWKKYNKKLLNLDSTTCFTIKYEELISSPKDTLEKLMGFLKLDFEIGQLAVSNEGSSLEVESERKGFSQDRINNSSELNSAEKLITYLVCKDLMKFYKYDHNNINLFQALPLLLIYAILLIFQLPIIVVFSFNNVRDLIRNIAS